MPLQFNNSDSLLTGVGPNPRKLINLIEGRPLHANQYAGDDALYLAGLKKLTEVARDNVPAGTNGSLKRSLSNMRTVQFNLCKLLICYQFVLAGVAGKHIRSPKGSATVDKGSASDADDEGEAELVELMRAECAKKRRKA